MKDTDKHYHQPVMVDEVLKALGLKESAPLKNSDKSLKIVDATLGTGGHTLEFIKRGASVLGIEWDKDIFKLAKKRLEQACPASEFPQKPFKLINASYENILGICKENDFLESDGVLFDLGLNLLHLKLKGRGFSFMDDDSSLDMRFNPIDRVIDAAALLNLLDKGSLFKLFSRYLSYKNAKDLSAEIVSQRKVKAYKNVKDFRESISKVLSKTKNISIETIPFMALRIAVNTELENVKKALPKAISILKHGGVLCVISFHSGEDSIVKKEFKRMSEDGLGEIVIKKPIRPGFSEIKNNPRSRSAKLRIFKKK